MNPYSFGWIKQFQLNFPTTALRMITYHSILLLISLFAVAFTDPTTYYVDVDWYSVTPVSLYINPGDTVVWFSTNASQSHWIIRIFANFSGSDLSSIPFSPLVIGPELLNYSLTFTEADIANEGQGFQWADALNPFASLYGTVNIARPDDVILDFNVFSEPANPGSSNPPFAVATAIYPLNATIMTGQRVIFRDAIETLIIHQISAGDGRNHLAACLTMPWVHTYSFGTRSRYWAWEFDTVGKFSWNCLIHPNEYGFIHVCEKKLENGVYVPDPERCGKWQRCQNSRHLAEDEEIGHAQPRSNVQMI